MVSAALSGMLRPEHDLLEGSAAPATTGQTGSFLMAQRALQGGQTVIVSSGAT